MAVTADMLRDLEVEMKKFQKLESDMSEVQARKKSRNSQKNENEMVIEELAFVSDDSILYKLIGPVLVKQTKAEVSSTVEQRLKFVKDEIQRCDDEYKDLQKQREDLRQKIIKMQQAISANKK